MTKIFRKRMHSILSILYPPRCPGCDEILYEKGQWERPKICVKCEGGLSFIHQPACQKCGKQLEYEEIEYCHDCTAKKHYFDRGIAAFDYSTVMKRSMYEFKYNNRREYARYYADVIVNNWVHLIKLWNADVLIPVPVSRERFRKRGYNQAEVLAVELSERLDIPVDKQYLIRVKNTLPQKNLNDKERQDNLNKAFQIVGNSVKYNKIIIIDDIYTTGATIDECARILKNNGARKVFFIAACIGHGF